MYDPAPGHAVAALGGNGVLSGLRTVNLQRD